MNIQDIRKITKDNQSKYFLEIKNIIEIEINNQAEHGSFDLDFKFSDTPEYNEYMLDYVVYMLRNHFTSLGFNVTTATNKEFSINWVDI